jgi:xylan 1,4-beta-xylosidase
MRTFLDHCVSGKNSATGEQGTPTDFISFHAKGHPTTADGHVRMGIAEQLRTINDTFKLIAEYPQLKSKPIVLGESDPDGCAACQGPQLGYRNGTLFSSYTAASFARKHDLADRHGVNLEGAVTWAFEFEDQPYFAGFRVLASNGIDLPVLNTFRLVAKMSPDRVAATSSGQLDLDAILKSGVRAQPDVGVLASAGENQATTLLWHYHDDDLPGPNAAVTVEITGLPTAKPVKLERWTIDETHSNAFTAWNEMGSPQKPTPEQYAKLRTAGQLQSGPEANLAVDSAGVGRVELQLPRRAVTLLIARW